MTRPGNWRPRAPRSVGRPGVEILEGRELPTASAGIGFLSAFGIGVTGKSSTIRSDAIATDTAGDTFLTGSFRGTASFDPHSSSSTITTAGTQDTFVAKYSPSGALLWVKTFAGKSTAASGYTTTATSQGTAIAVDGSGNVFVAGGFSGTVDLPGGSNALEISSPLLTTEVYLARLDPSGNVSWVTTVAGTSEDTDEANAVALDGSGGAVIAGSFADSATFGASTLSAGGASEGFAARVDSGGNFRWAVATRGASGSNAQVNGVAVDGSGNVALAGFYSGTVDFDPGAGVTSLTAAGSDDAMLWKLDANGHLLWARSYGSADYDTADAVAVDPSGNFYVTGAFSDALNFGPGSTNDTLTAGPIFDAFALKVAPNGAEVWAKGLVGPGGWSKGQGIVVDPSGNVHLAGTFQGTVDFDPNTGTDNLTSVGDTDVFAVGLNASGNLLYALQAGQTNFNAALGVALDPSGNLAITGTYATSIAFGSTGVTSAGVSGAFVAHVQTQAPLPPPPSAPSSPSLEASSDTGASSSDDITAAKNPVFDVTTADASNTVELLRNGVVVGQRLGPGPIADLGPITDGTDSYTAVQVTPSGVAGTASTGLPVRFLITPPPAPAAPTLFAGDITGPSGGSLTSNRQPRITGTARAGSTINVLTKSGALLATSTASTVDGSYTVRLASPLGDGVATLDVVAVDVAGNVSQASPPLTFTVDTTPPAPPSVLTLLAADDSGAVGDALTNVRQPRLTGKGEPGATIQVLDASNKVVASAVAATDGTFTAKLTSPLADGTYSFQARATDPAGNVGLPGSSASLTILATPPSAPTAASILPADDSGGPALTNVRQPRFTGKAASNGSIQILGPTGVLYASATTGSDGSYVAKVTTPLTDGSYSLHLVATDAAGNISPSGTTWTVAILATPPGPPSTPALLPADDTGALNDGMTSVRRPRLGGTAAPGGRVDWISADGSVLASATASASTGSYQIQPPTALPNGTYPVRVRETDLAGNFGPTSPPFNVTIRADAGDAFGVGQVQVGIFRPSVSTFYLQGSPTSSFFAKQFGTSGDVPVHGDFFGNGHDDIAIFRPSTATFYAADPVTGAVLVAQLGTSGDVPVPADYDGDGRADFAVFRPSTNTFYIESSTTGTIVAQTFAIAGDIPVPADYFGDGHADVAVYRPSVATFYALDPVTGAFRVASVGTPNAIPVPADYEGLGHADFAVFQPGNSTFVVQMTASKTMLARPFGLAGDLPVPADYTGDGRVDIAVYRPSTSTFYSIDLVSNAYRVAQWGAPGLDVPALAPITANFSFGTSARPNVVGAGSSPSVQPSVLVPLAVPSDSTDPTSTSTAKKAATVDIAIEALSLESWRPGT